MTVSFSSITTTTGIVAGQIYFVVGATTNTFQVAATSGGAALSLTNDGTGIILPYKQVIVTVTPQAGQTITSFNLNVRNNSAGTPTSVYDSGWLDLALSFPSCTTLTVGASSAQVLFRLLEQVNLVNVQSVLSFANLFRLFTRLSNIVQINSQAVTATNSMFQECTSLVTVPLFNTVNVTAMNSMFNGCTRLQTLPLFNTSNVTTFSGMFFGCSSLVEIPLYDTSKVLYDDLLKTVENSIP
jgi:surface protein